MKKLVTFNEKQGELYEQLMEDTYQSSPSAFFVYLMLFYQQNQKRAPGRPRNQTDRDDDAPNSNDDEDTIEKYRNPDKNTTSPYSYNDLVSWYDYHPEAGPMPARSDLIIHPSYKGKR